LWDVVDVFDPIKLAWYDPYRTAAYANDLLDPVSRAITAVSPGQMPSSQLLEGAQHLAAVNRHLVTTDSYDLTAANQTMPAWVSDFGADGAPGRRGQTNQTLNLAGTDDFQVIIGVPRARATIVDLLRYRVWLEARRYEMRRLNLTEMDVDRLSAANYTTFIKGITLRADAVVVVNSQLAQDLLAPEVIEGRRMDLNRPLGDGTDNNANGVVDDPLEAGDPFLDVNGNGKCDPGEPFIDLFGSGTYVGPGVPHPTQGNICDQLWAGLTGNGTLREQIVFDYTNGHAEPVHNLVAAAVKSAFGQVPHGVRNLESQGRQLFARHLYCLMLLLTDENYIAPWDENDGQFTTWMTNERNKLIAAFPSMNPGEADAIIKRKATCRMIAQWAVNCVDMRDADAIMTSFEYTDNPWFGWGVWDDIWAKDPATWPTSITDPKFPTMIPLDGDVATDENKGEVIDWSIVSKNTTPGGTPSNANTKKLTALPTANVPTNPLDQTRGEVWGAERPELLITEALAFHDRRTEDVPSNDSNGHGEMRKYDKTRKPGSYGMDPNYTYYNQPNPSQSLRPRGSLFVEVYNPWSPQAQLPAEIYSPFDVSTGYTYDSTKPRLGVDLGRLSNLAWDDIKGQLTSAPTQVLPDPANPAIAKTSIKRSPVWRMIAVEEWPDSRNADELDDVHLDKLDPSSCIIDPATGQIKPNTGKPYKFPGPKEPQRNKDIAAKVKAWTPSAMDPVPPFRPTDPDFDPLFANNMLQVQTAIPADPTQKITTTYLVGTAYGKGGRLGMQIGTTNDNTNQPTMNGEPKNQFYVSYPNIEREFYFTTDKSPMAVTDIRQLDLTEDYDYSPSKFRIRIPDRSVHIRYPSTASGQPKAAQTQKFIDLHLELGPRADQTTFVNKNAAVISPIMPGRYCVIGSAGTNYNYDPTDPAKPKNQIYTTTVGRLNLSSVGTGWNTDDLQHDPFQTRRIEMHPMTARGISEPTKQQLLVASNGGDPNDDQPSVATVNNQTVIGYDPTTKEIGRDNELIYDNSPGGGKKVKNVVSEDTNKNLHADYYQPCVTIPVAGMNISEPAWGYAAREYEAAVDELEIMRAGGKARSSTPQLATFRTKPNSGIKDYEGRYYSDLGGQGAVTSYAAPFDGYKEKPIALELVRTGTTANYRTIHLQRLANPLLPWNPESKLANGEPNPEWRPNMPINPYRTIDSSSVNLTAFNGVSKVEANYAQVDRPKQQQELFQLRPWEDSNTEQSDYVTKTFVTGGQVWDFRSQERGWWSRLNVLGSVASPAANVPQRVVWGQEPPMVKLKQTNFTLFDLIPSRQMTMRSSSKEIPTSPVTVMTEQNILDSRVNMVMQHTLGFGNRSLGLLYDSKGAKQANFPSNTFKSSSAAPIPAAVGAPASCYYTWDNDGTKPYSEVENSMVRFKVDSTDPWLAWDDRPFVSAEELLKVPATSQSQMLRQYSTIDSGAPAANRPNPYGLASLGAKPTPANGYFMVPNATRWKVMQAPFGQLANVFAASGAMCDVVRDTDLPPTLIPSGYNVRGVPVRFATSGATAGTPILPDDPTKEGDVQPFGGPNFSRILDYVQVPSRFVGTDTMLNAETFNDVPGVTDTVGLDITSSADPRYNFQPPFNKVSRERDPGRVNLNTVIGRRAVENGVPHIWSEVFDGIMNRVRDTNPSNSQISHFGPAWRDVALSRRGYAQFDALGNLIDKPLDKPASDPTAKPVPTAPPDTLQLGLNNNFPTFFSNPFRSSDAGDLVPLDQMIQRGVDASLERVHPRNRGSIIDASGAKYDSVWGGAWPAGFSAFFDARDAGFGNDGISVRPNGAIPNTALLLDPSVFGQRDLLPLFSESRNQPFADTDRNPYMMYEPMSRLGNLVTNRSGCYAVWITVGYFEVEPAPSWSDSNVQAHFGGDLNLYNRVYPDGYMLGKELGSETGDVKRPRGFYIIDRTEEVGFKPGEDLNVEKTIRLRRRIE
jgi:hypothetical protein